MKSNIAFSLGHNQRIIESRLVEVPGQPDKSMTEINHPVEIQEAIILFPWVDTIQESFISNIQPYWLTSKDQIVSDLTQFIQGTRKLSSENLYVLFWGVLTSSIVLYFSNKSELNGKNIFYYFIVLAIWSLASACLIFFYAKISRIEYTSFLANVNLISISYPFLVLPLALISCSPLYLKVFFSIVLFALLTYILVKNYSHIWNLALPKTIPIYLIFGITNLLMIYLCFFLSYQKPQTNLVLLTPVHNSHLYLNFLE